MSDLAPATAGAASMPPLIDGAAGTVTQPGPSTDSCEDTVIVAGETPLRRLTRVEYENTVHDLLGDETAPANAFLLDEKYGKFANNSVAPVSDLLVEQYQNAARTLAVAAAQRLDTLLPCDAKTVGEEACVRQVVTDFGARAYRAPLDATEVEELVALYRAAQVAATEANPFAARLAVVLESMLVAPEFLYRPVLGTPVAGQAAEIRALTGYELASRLSYMLWASIPDAELQRAAGAGELSTPEQLRGQAERLMQDPRFAKTVSNFNNQWLRVDAILSVSKDPTVYPEFSESLRRAMQQETEMFAEEVVLRGDGRLQTLFNADFTFVNRELATFYGIPYDAQGDEWLRVPLPAERAGILTQASLLATLAGPDHGSPVQRGVMIRENILCQTLPPPPPGVNNVPPPPVPGMTNRERFESHTADALCASCHSLIDGIGYGLEHFDGIGRYRALDSDKPVDATGTIINAKGIDGTYDGAAELSAKLGSSDEVRACVSDLWLEYILGRPVSTSDACSRDAAYAAFAAADFNIRELLLATVGSNAFRFTRVVN